MSRKVTIIGAGSVGATVAFMMAVKGIATEIVMIDIDENKALGEAMDIHQGAIFTEPVRICAGGYGDAAGSDIVVIASGVPRKPGQTRLDLAEVNAGVMKSIASEISRQCPDAIYVIVSNPVDVLTYVFNRITDVPEGRIIGTGTLLDTARVRSRLADCLEVSQRNVHAYVLGEHGDSAFVPWSVTQISSLPIEKYRERLSPPDGGDPAPDYGDIEQYMRTSGGRIIAYKGATYYAIATSVCHICDCIFSDASEILTLSGMMHGEYGIDDVCLSVPTILNGRGMCEKVILDLTGEELGKLHRSADALRGIISRVWV